jgi:molybdopterin converting factor small subunit
MSVEVRLHPLLVGQVGRLIRVRVEATNLNQLIEELEGRFPGFKGRLNTPEGELQPFVSIFVNEEDVRFLGGTNTVLKDGDIVSFLPAMSGGEKS